jgi:uncharacterized protein (DUF1778 family)
MSASSPHATDRFWMPSYEEALAEVRERLSQRGSGDQAARRPMVPQRPSTSLVQLSVRVPEELRRAVREAADASGISTQEFVLRALRERLRQVELTEEPTPGLVEFNKAVWEMIWSGELHREIEDGLEPELRSM